MKFVIILEELAMTVVALYLLSQHSLGISPLLWILLFFTPDLGMLGYLANARIGAFTYNVFHHKGLAIAIVLAGYALNNEVLIAIGILLFAHASFDRIFGYGLKYSSGFKNTHLGSLDKKITAQSNYQNTTV